MSRPWSVAGMSLESLSALTLDSFSFDPFADPASSPHGEANPSGLRSEQEIAAFAIDESLDDVQRALALLASPHAVQRHSLLFQLPGLLAVHPEQCHPLLSRVTSLMRELSDEQLTLLTELYADLMQRRLVPLSHVTDFLLPRMLDFLSPAELPPGGTPTSSSPTAASAAASLSAASTGSGTTALHRACVELLTNALRHHAGSGGVVERLTDFSAEAAESIHSSSRLIAALLFARLPPHVPAASLLPLLPSALALCQDTSMEVRTAMCGALGPLAAVLSSSQSSLASLATELSELLRDEELTVQQAALLSLPPPLLPSVMSVLRGFFASPPKGLHAVLARVFGELLVGLGSAGVGGGSDGARLMRDFYRSSSTGQDGDIRYWCVYNAPALLTLIAPVRSSSHPPGSQSASVSSPRASLIVPLMDFAFLAPLLTGFSHDAHPPVRVSLSRSLPVLAPLLLALSQSHFRLVKELILTLLKDAEPSVRDTVVASLPALLAMPSPPPDASSLTELFRCALQLDGAAMTYRARIEWLSTLYALRLQFASHELQYMYYDRLSPVLFSALHASPPAPLLALLLSVLNHFLSSLPSAQRRHDLLQRLLRECGPGSRSCYDRLLFLSLVDSWTAVFSRRWLRRHVLAALLKMAAVETVREVKVRLLTVMGRVERGKALDAKDKEAWSRTVLALCQDADRYVSDRAKEWVKRRAAEERSDDAEEERRDRALEEREERLLKDEEELTEQQLRKEQMRERNALLNQGGAGGASNNAVMLHMIKQQKKEREKDKEREKRAQANSADDEKAAPSSPHALPLSASTPTTTRSLPASSSMVMAPTLSPIVTKDRKTTTIPPRPAAGRLRGTTADKAGAMGEADGEDEKKEKRGRAGHLPGLSTSSSAAPSPSSSASVAAFRSPIAASSVSAAGKKALVTASSATALPSPSSLHPLSRRYPSGSTPSSASSSTSSTHSAAVSPATLGSPSSSSASSSGLVIPALSSSPRVVKVSPVTTKSRAAATPTVAPAGFGLTGSAMLKSSKQ